MRSVRPARGARSGRKTGINVHTPIGLVIEIRRDRKSWPGEFQTFALTQLGAMILSPKLLRVMVQILTVTGSFAPGGASWFSGAL